MFKRRSKFNMVGKRVDALGKQQQPGDGLNLMSQYGGEKSKNIWAKRWKTVRVDFIRWCRRFGRDEDQTYGEKRAEGARATEPDTTRCRFALGEC